MNFQYKIAKASHNEELFQLEKICFPHDAWSFESIKNTLDNERNVCFIACFNDKIVGYAIASVIYDECELNRIAVLPEFRKLKIGEKLIENLIQKCKSCDCRIIYLEVRESNDAAIGLYIKSGFIKCGMRKEYYRHPVENAVLMSLEF